MNAKEAGPLDPQRQRAARAYASAGRRLFFIATALQATLLSALAFSGAGAALSDALSLPWVAQLVVVVAALSAGSSLLFWPLDVYGGYSLPRRFGLLTQPFAGWLRDRLKGMALSAAIVGSSLLLLYLLLRTVSDLWWLPFAGYVILLNVILNQLGPVLILPLFFKQRPLDDPVLSARLASIAQRTGHRVTAVFTIDFSSKGTWANAFLTGMGKTRRIVLADTLLESHSVEEVEVIFAHELAHHVHRDVGLWLALQSLAVVGQYFVLNLVLRAAEGPLGLNGLADPGALPLLALTLGGLGLLAMPFANALSRWRERLADGFSLRQTGNAAAFVSSMARLTDRNLSEANPPAWAKLLFWTHPPFWERVAMAQQAGPASESLRRSQEGTGWS